jgi:hypothetical protein
VILFAVISPVVDKEVIVVVARDTVPVAVRVPVVRLEVEALERLVWPATVSVPLDTSDEVAVMLPERRE